MGWGDWVKRAGAAVATGGLSEGYRQLKKGSLDRTNNEFKEIDPEGNINRIGAGQERFGNRAETDFQAGGNRMTALGEQLQRLTTGQDSLSAENLRQSLALTQAAQQSAAAGARGGNQAMAARTAVNNMARQQTGLAGQQAVAGIQERQAAQQALGNLLAAQRGQDLQAAQGAGQLALNAYGGIEDARTQRYNSQLGIPTDEERILGLAGGAAQAALQKSDRRAKTAIADGDDDAENLMKGLKAYTWKYKNSKDGQGEHLGIMAQDLEKTKLGKQAVIDTPDGKMVHGTKLATALAAATANLNKRLSKLEKK